MQAFDEVHRAIHRSAVFVSGSIPGLFLHLQLSLSLQWRLRGDNI
jgi:hypothetical protein